MYKMHYFTEPDLNIAIEFMRAHPFVTLIGSHHNTPVATQVPVLVEKQNNTVVVRGHIMRKTDHHLALQDNPQTLMLFQGPHCYVSASWYSERGHGSTWNYMTVHARGTVQFMDEAGTLQLIKDLTHKYEDHQKQPQQVAQMDMDGYVRPMLSAIAGFEIEITEMHPIFKLSQNRDDESFKNIVAELEETEEYNSRAIAHEMRIRRPKLFE